MFIRVIRGPVLIAVVAVAMLAGCDRLFSQKGQDAFNMAREKEKEGDYRAAVQWYEASLDGTVRSAEAHYNMALIFDDKLDNAVAALDHFRRYIELAPDGQHVKDAQSFAAQDEFKLANTLSKGNFMPQQDAARLKNQNFELQQQLTDARKQLADLRAVGRVTISGANDPQPVPAGSHTYRVQPGDTLSSISRMFFKTSSRWRDIQSANPSALGNSVKLKAGMTLVIPSE